MIFIVGYSRSGTKLINQILDKLEIADSVPEVHFFEQLYEFSSPESVRNKSLTPGEAVSACDKLLGITARIGTNLDNGRAVADVNEAMTRYVKTETSLTLLHKTGRCQTDIAGRDPATDAAGIYSETCSDTLLCSGLLDLPADIFGEFSS